MLFEMSGFNRINHFAATTSCGDAFEAGDVIEIALDVHVEIEGGVPRADTRWPGDRPRVRF